MSLDDVDRQVRQLKEAFMTGSGVVPITRTTEATKKPVDASAPTEPIEDTNGGEGAKPPFAAMVDAAKAALLAGDDPHAAVESMLGHTDEGEPADVSRAVKAALKQLEVEEKEAELKMEGRMTEESEKWHWNAELQIGGDVTASSEDEANKKAYQRMDAMMKMTKGSSTGLFNVMPTREWDQKGPH